jgi:hypothetical protein
METKAAENFFYEV